MSKDLALDNFVREVNKPDNQIILSGAVLTMGQFEYPNLDVEQYSNQLHQLARQALAASGSQALSAVRLAQYLFQEAGYKGNTLDYVDPRNSYLNEVIVRRLGIPISLSVLFIEVARHLDQYLRQLWRNDMLKQGVNSP